MDKKFAVLDNVANADEIHIHNIIKKGHPKLVRWYIKKFNPYKIQNLNIGDIEGIKITMPFTNDDLYYDNNLINELFLKTIKVLKTYSVETVSFCEDYDIQNLDIYRANGKYLMPFFLLSAIRKSLHIVNKDIGKVEIVIISGDTFLTEVIIDNIYLDVNFISILIDNNDDFIFNKKAREVFVDSGLDINITKESNYILKNADIIINTSSKLDKFDYFFKSGAIYFELAGKKERVAELARRRDDMLVIDDFGIIWKEEKYKLDYFEMGYYASSKQYKNFVNKSFYADKVKDQLKDLDIKFNCFYCLTKILNKISFIKFKNKGGI